MAESLAEKLKRLAREKKEAAAKAAEVTVVADDQPKGVEEVKDERITDSQESTGAVESEVAGNCEEFDGPVAENPESTGIVTGTESEISGQVIGSSSIDLTLQPTPSDHPLAMQFAELESALLTTDPRFKTILRDVHRHLGQDPDLVTLMTEGEVAMIVRGLVTFANAEIVAPAKTKALKSASKKAISADDL